MSQDMPPLAWLRAFEASARHLNFSRAAEELALTPAAVSYQVRSLEDTLGYPLFLRNKRPMELTTMGQLYLPWVTRGFGILGQGTRDVFGQRNTRPVRIRCLQSFAILWLIPNLPAFRKAHPDIALQLHMGSWSSTLDADQLDIDIRFGEGRWGDHTGILLRKDPIVPVCHPDLRPAEPRLDALLDQPLIEIIGVTDTWHRFFQQEGLTPPASPAGLHADQSVAALDLAAQGLGHVLTFGFFADPYFREGRLIRSVPAEKRSKNGLYLLATDDPANSGSRIFADWLLARFQDMA